jgi:hopanoid-associated phosphorylase
VLVVVGLKDEAEVAAGWDVKVVTSAANAKLLRERLAEVDVTRLSAVVSFGIAGALDEELEVGDLRVATRVVSGEQAWRADLGMRSALRLRLDGVGGLEFEETVFLGNDELTGVDAEANRVLHRGSGASVVDMESHLVAEFAQRSGLPFAAIRAISDTAHQELPAAALLPLLPDGSGDWKAVLNSVLWQPSQIPDLWKMVKGFNAAMETLRAVRERLSLADLVQLPDSGPCAGDASARAAASGPG